MKKHVLVFIALLCLLVFAQQEGSMSPQESLPVTGTFTDPRDGQTYRTVKIGNQTWMAENLKFYAEGSVCFGEGSHVRGLDEETREPRRVILSDIEIQANCVRYGRLYNWATAMELPSTCNNNVCASQVQTPHHQGICPAGWHIPSGAEWEALVNHAGGSSVAGVRLRSREGWHIDSYYIPGTDDYGFSALPGGIGHGYDGLDGDFYSNGYAGVWWSTTEGNGTSVAQQWIINHSSRGVLDRLASNKMNQLSLRCVKDVRP
jgi:uncharacterized protein (TIGR02145 family)